MEKDEVGAFPTLYLVPLVDMPAPADATNSVIIDNDKRVAVSEFFF